MTYSEHQLPPLSPVLMTGMALRVMPLSVLNALLAKSIKVMLTRHGHVFERLKCLKGATFAIDPIDLPFLFLLRPDHEAPTLQAVQSHDPHSVTASIHGSFSNLTRLLEGEVDGDALVFSRDLVIEGDTEAVLALRNAVDGGDIHIKQDLASIFGPLSGVAEKAADKVTTLVARAGDDMEMLQGAMINRLTLRSTAHSAQIEDLEEQMVVLQKKMKKLRKRT